MRAILWALVPVALAVGCSGGGMVPEGSPYKPKLDAALAISNTFERDAALARVATEAAGDGDVPVVKKALREMHNSFEIDKAAEVCALRLAKNGKGHEANEVAGMIHSTFQKDAVLSKLAKGEFPP